MRTDEQIVNYVVGFSDGTAKTGISSKPFYRLQDYVQEAHRHGVKVIGFKITAPAASKAHALRIETTLCAKFELYARPGHREWFFDDLLWCRPRARKLFGPETLFNHICVDLDIVWESEHRASLHWRDWMELYRRANRSYNEVKEFAQKLGSCGARISATRATALAAGMVIA